jgi:hypothetical protein
MDIRVIRISNPKNCRLGIRREGSLVVGGGCDTEIVGKHIFCFRGNFQEIGVAVGLVADVTADLHGWR